MRIFQWMAIVGMTLFFPISALAINLGATDLGTAGTNAGVNQGVQASLGSLVGSMVNIILNILGAILFILFVYAGFLWMTAKGDEKQVKKAKDIMGNALVGLIITLTAQSMVFFIAATFPGGYLLWTQSTSDVVTGAGLTGSNILIEDNIGALINILLNVLGIVLLLIFLYAGFLWMTAQGDSKQVDKAKMMMRNAVIGLVITLLSRAMATFVIERLVTAEIAYLPEAIHSTIVT